MVFVVEENIFVLENDCSDNQSARQIELIEILDNNFPVVFKMAIKYAILCGKVVAISTTLFSIWLVPASKLVVISMRIFLHHCY